MTKKSDKNKNTKKDNDFELWKNRIDSEIEEKDDIVENKWKSKNKKKTDVKKMTIEYFWTNLTKECKDLYIDPVIWRNSEIDQIIYTLLRKNKNNPLLLWEAWVWKTAIVEGLAHKIVKWEVPDKLKNKKIFLLDMGTLVAGTKYRWEFESRLKSILEEASDPTNNIILFIDEIHTIIWAWWHDTNDAAQLIKPLLARWKIKLIWATTFDEYQKHIEKDTALKRRFQEIYIKEPSSSDTKKILEWLKKIYEDFHWVQISNEAIENSVLLTQRYILDKHLPDKALDVLDEACAKKSVITDKLQDDIDYKKKEKEIKKLQKKIELAIEKQDYFKAASFKEEEEQIKKEMNTIRMKKNIPVKMRPKITKKDIWDVLSSKIWVPSNVVNESEIEKLKKLWHVLKDKILWQDNIVDIIVNTVSKSRLSVVEKDKPIWSFLFLWPSWVWKTYLAKLIAKEYFWSDESLIRFDMSEFMEKYSVSKLIWAPSGYIWYDEWWNLTEAVRRNPYSVILFDEIEKASSDVLNILLQILDEWKLKDSKWRIVNFKSTIIIMTSNIWSEEFSKKKVNIWFELWNKKDELDKSFNIIKDRIKTQLKDYITPELLNRIDHIEVFNILNKKILSDIFNKEFWIFINQWKKSDISLPKFTNDEILKIIDEIYDPQYWARPVKKYIYDKIENKLIKKMLNK